MSRTYRKGPKRTKPKGNQYPSRLEQTAIKHAIPAFANMLVELGAMRKDIIHHREMCSGHQHNNMRRTEQGIKEAIKWAEIVLANLKEDAHWLNKS